MLESTSACSSAVAQAEQYTSTTLPGNLDTMLGAIRSHAPNAKVVVTDYPEFYDTSVSFCLGLSSTDHKSLDAGISQLDGPLAAAAARAGALFPAGRGHFAGHELCDGSGGLNSIAFPIENSYHPTATGQKSGYLPVFTAAAR